MANDRLRAAMTAAHMDIESVARAVGVDPKTVQLVTPYLFARHGFEHPLLHRRRLGADGLFASFADQFETLWAASTPAART